MKGSRLNPQTLGLCAIVAMLAGCGGAQGVAPNAATVSAPQGAASTRSWLSPSGLRSALVYLAIEGTILVYSYPGGKQVGTLTDVKNPGALCSDTSGNVWVTELDSRRHSTLLKYAHDGSKPIANLSLNSRANACSVDPSTGNLAVGTLNSNVAVWTNGQGSPTLYSTGAFFKEVQTVAYDGNGNLYMRSFVASRLGAWLPKGGATVMEFHIRKLGSYAWDGRYFVIGPANGYTESMTRYKLHGASGKVVGKVRLNNCAPSYEPGFSIAGSKLAVSCGLDETNSLNYYRYSKGGNPIRRLDPGQSGSVAISVAPSGSRR
jgi:hypothetical protein